MGNQLRLQIEKWWRKKRMIFCPMLVTRMWVSLLLVILLGNFFFSSLSYTLFMNVGQMRSHCQLILKICLVLFLCSFLGSEIPKNKKGFFEEYD